MQEDLNITEYVAEEVVIEETIAPDKVVIKETKIKSTVKAEPTMVGDIEAPETSKELVSLGNLLPADVFKKDSGHVDDLLNKIKEQVRSEIFDISTEKGRTRIRSVARKIGGAKGTLKGMAQDLTEDRKAEIKIVTTETTRMEKEFDKFRDEHLAPLKAWEAKQEEHEGALNFISTLAVVDLIDVEITAELIQERMDIIAHDSREWGDFSERAKRIKQESYDVLKKKLAAVKKKEEDKAELERLQKADEERLQKERDDEIAKDAKDKADREAEEKAKQVKFDADFAEATLTNDKMIAEKKAEEDAKQAKFDADFNEATLVNDNMIAAAKAEEERLKVIEDAKQAKIKADKDAEDAAEQAEIDKQKALDDAAAAVEAEKKKEEDEAAEREADLAHTKKINNEALKAIVTILDKTALEGALDGAEEKAKAIITAIAQDKIPHISIKY